MSPLSRPAAREAAVVEPVRISEVRCAAAHQVLETYALGSCVAVVLHDARRSVGGLLHFMLPVAQGAQAAARPAMFGDTGLRLMLAALEAAGSRRADLWAVLVGGGVMNDPGKIFQIGARNVAAMRELLREAGIAVRAEDVGGPWSRSVRYEVAGGVVLVRSRGQERKL